MSHNFNWKNIPDSSKLRTNDEFVDEEDNSKFSFEHFYENMHNQIFVNNSIQLSFNDINNLNLIINDNECSNSFIESICQSLDLNGVNYIFSRQENVIIPNNGVFITLDQQYVSGPKISIIGAYDNNRNDNSDALALAMDVAFKSKDMDSDGVFCGKRGYRQDDTGVSTRVPTPTEEAIPLQSATSFVTISFGTNVKDSGDIADAIIDGLGRYIAYIRTRTTNADLIKRADSGDKLGTLSSYFNVSSFDISNLNNIDDVIPSDEAIINPSEYASPAFDKKLPVVFVEKESTKTIL